LSHESELTRKFDIKFHLGGLVSDIIECTDQSCVRRFAQYSDSIIHHHLGHVRSDQWSCHIRFLDSVHGCDTDAIRIQIGIIQLFREGRSNDRTRSCYMISSCGARCRTESIIETWRKIAIWTSVFGSRTSSPASWRCSIIYGKCRNG
jgi:hypothetical protein